MNNMPTKVWSFKRVKGENEVHCLFNFGDKEVIVTFDEQVAGEDFKDLFNRATSGSIESVKLKPWEYNLYYKN
ncbi:MAG: hypothetical protein GX921_07965 [Bacteroidales bacterium]|nr:hypothetical protein [Bacteroidales bacterium]